MALLDLWGLGPSEVISVVGAGGKSTLLEALAREYEREGQIVVLTTTTKIWVPEEGGRPLVTGDSLEEILGRLADVLHRRPGVSPIVGTRVLTNGKLDCVPPEWVASLRDAPGIAAVIVEADGANRLPLKAPAGYEPVVPECSTMVVAMCGLDAQATPLDAEHVHRPELLGSLLGLALGERVAAERLPAALILGYAESVPRHARLVLLFNKADTAPPLGSLVEAARLAPVDVWVGALAGEGGPIVESLRRFDRTPVIVVLAAGLSSRMHGHKLSAELEGRSIVGRVVETAVRSPRYGPVVVVTGHEAERVLELLRQELSPESEGREWIRAHNPHPELGMSSSLRVAAEAAGGKDLLILLGDQPFVRPKTLCEFAAVMQRKPRCAGVALASEGGSWGPPVLIARTLVPLIGGLEGDGGARSLLSRYELELETFRGEPLELFDVDDPEDLREARELVRGPETSL